MKRKIAAGALASVGLTVGLSGVAGASGAAFAFGTPGPDQATVTLPDYCTAETPCTLYANLTADLGTQTTWAGPYSGPGSNVTVTFPAGWCGGVQLDVIGTAHFGRKGQIAPCNTPPTTVPPSVPPTTVPPPATVPPASVPPAPSAPPVPAPSVPVSVPNPTRSGPELPNTGAPVGTLAALGSTLLAIGWALTRKWRAAQ